MIVTLAGPDDLGYFFLDDENGRSFPLVERHEDHPAAAALFGWKSPEEVKDKKAIIHDAIDWLTDHAGEDFEAPQHVAEFFEKLNDEADE